MGIHWNQKEIGLLYMTGLRAFHHQACAPATTYKYLHCIHEADYHTPNPHCTTVLQSEACQQWLVPTRYFLSPHRASAGILSPPCLPRIGRIRGFYRGDLFSLKFTSFLSTGILLRRDSLPARNALHEEAAVSHRKCLRTASISVDVWCFANISAKAVSRWLCLKRYLCFTFPHTVVSNSGCGETGNAYAGSNQSASVFA